MKPILRLICLLLLFAIPVSAQEPTEEPEDEAILEISADTDALEFAHYQVNEVRFNPSPERPAALIMMSSLDFTNISGKRLEVRYPRLNLSINGVEWTELASTDFQIGRLQRGATQGIELQSLLVVRKATEEQQAVLELIQTGEAVDLEITGTILVYPNDKEETVELTITLENIILPSNWGQSQTDSE